MNLTREHRKSLVQSLTEEMERRVLLEKHVRAEQIKIDAAKDVAKYRDPYMMASIQMDQFLNDQNIVTIETVLIENEIDF